VSLHHTLELGAALGAERIAVEEPGFGSIRYGELVRTSDSLRDRLHALGVRRGDRVGIYLKKSIDGVAAIFGILKAGAAHVPVDPTAPVARNAFIHADCQVKVAIVERRLEAAYREELQKLGHSPELLILEGTGAGKPLAECLAKLPAAPRVPSVESQPDDLAYVLYTSGSTGKPKGVMLTHRSAQAFVDWCSDAFAPTRDDRFSNHAPFHFDLSVLDLYTPLKHGATLVIVSEETGKEPAVLAKLIADQKLTVWYSAPSILGLMAQYGNLASHDFGALRTVLFAGEVFPVVHLRSLVEQWPRPRYFNLYGPTETNVCTYYEIPRPIAPERTEPFPIGPACAHYRARVVDPDGADVPFGAEGELVMAGPGVMAGYWNLPEQTSQCFLTGPDGTRWYRTGDLVVEERETGYIFHGRRDRMVKKRGYRVELGEIEACLYKHPNVREAAAIALSDSEGVKIKAHVSTRDGKRISIIELKKFCSGQVPLYMVPDAFAFHESLPKTSTDKTDYQQLRSLG
jgi:amino acid adenylation domain-containing protein